MKNTICSPWISVALCVAVLLISAGCTQQQSAQGPAQTIVSTSPGQPYVSVEIKGFAFDPPTVKVAPGTRVVWLNSDPVSHRIVSDSSDELNSDPMDQGRTYGHTFDKAGTYAYHCSIHPSMKGTVIVGT